MELTIEFEAGLIGQSMPEQPFVVLADPAAVPEALQWQWRRQWGAACRGWVAQAHGQSTVPAALALAGQLWPLLAQQAGTTLWAIGGGTTLDLAKLLRWRLASPDQAAAAWTANHLPDHALRHTLWCSPSTAGTGSEVTPWATVWELGCMPPRKRSWHPPHGLPDQARVDPLLTLSCPPEVTRDCALDALAHALDSLCNRRADATSRGQARQAARRILIELPAVLAAPQDVGARIRLAHASLLGGLAMGRTQTALAHALSYELTLNEGLSHGHACAVWLPMVVDLAAQNSPRVQADLQTVFDKPAGQAAALLSDWLQRLGIRPRDLRDSPEGLARLAQALTSERGANFVMAGA